MDTRLDFNLGLKNVQNKVNKTMGLLHQLQHTLPRTSLTIIFKSFIRPHLDYEDIIYDWACNTSFHQNIESIQYNAALAIMGAKKGTFREKNYQGLGLESLQQRRWYIKPSFKIINNQSFSTSPLAKHQIFFLKLKPTSDKTWLFSKLIFPLNYKTVKQSGPANQKIQKH